MSTVCIVGLGYVGLPMACMFASHGAAVIGVDINPSVLERIGNGGVSRDEPGLRDAVRAALRSGGLRVQGQVAAADAFVIAVPTPVAHSAESAGGGADAGSRPSTDRFQARADLSYVVAAATSIAPQLRPGNLVVLESTCPPHTTEYVVRPILERGGLRAGQDFSLAYCPERVLPGRIMDELVHSDRIVGGVNATSAAAARDLYATFVRGEILITDASTAEMVKLMENTYRDVNIALANEFSLVADELGLDVREAIQLANRHPRISILQPGPGVGGHCIPVDPWFLVQAAPERTPLIQAARQVNDGMPAHVAALVVRSVAGIAQPIVACLGLSYKANVDDVRGSPAIDVVRLLTQQGYTVRVCDPHVSVAPDGTGPLCTLAQALDGADCAVVLVDHDEFRVLGPEALVPMRRPQIIDTRGALNLAVHRGPQAGEAGAAPAALGVGARA